MILSFELPFALIPLLKFTSSKNKMGSYVNSTLVTVITWAIGILIMAINLYYLGTSFVKVLLRSGLRIVSVVFAGITGFSGMLIYLAAIMHLVFRKNKEITHLLPVDEPEPNQRRNDSDSGIDRPIYTLPREDIVSMQLPQRRSTRDLD